MNTDEPRMAGTGHPSITKDDREGHLQISIGLGQSVF